MKVDKGISRMMRATTLSSALVTLLFVLTTSSHAQLGTALDAPELTWTTSGTGGTFLGWSVQSTTTHDGVSAAQSSTLTSSSQSSTIQTTVMGPGTLTFWWRSSSVNNRLSFIAGSTTMASISGNSAWQRQTIYLGPGTHTLKWTYSYVTSGGFGERSYLDEVTYTEGEVAPFILTQPQSQSQLPGLNSTFTVALGGTPPLSYQWRFNDNDIPGATDSSFTITNVQATNLGSYSVLVTNVAGLTTSSNADLEFGTLAAWGADASGPVWVTAGATNIIAVACGINHSLALRSDGTLLQWGPDTPANPSTELTNLIAIAAGGGYSLALRSDGRLLAWGQFAFNPTNVPTDLTNAVAIAAGNDHALALKPDGTVVAWANTTSSSANVPAGLTNVVAIAGGVAHSLALKRDGTVIAWGTTSVPADLTNFVGISAGFSHSLALRSDGTVRAWGLLGGPVGLSNAVAIASGYFRGLALESDGTVTAWGGNTYGESNVPAGLTNVVAVAAAASHNLALVGDGPPIQSVLTANPIYSDDGFSLTVPSQSGRVFSLEYKDSLVDEDWTYLPLVAGTGKTLTLTDPTATNSTQRFYRVRRW